MHLTHLSLHNFRNFVRLDLDLPAGVTVLFGDNAQGKTNLLEAVYYLATTRSPHAGADRELVNWLAAENEPLPYARLVGRVARGGGEVAIEITLIQQNNGGKRYRKQIRVNGVTRRAMDLLGHLNVVLFRPRTYRWSLVRLACDVSTWMQPCARSIQPTAGHWRTIARSSPSATPCCAIWRNGG